MVTVRRLLLVLAVFAVISTALLYIYQVSDRLPSVSHFSKSSALIRGIDTSESSKTDVQKEAVPLRPSRASIRQDFNANTEGQKSVEHKKTNVLKKRSGKKKDVIVERLPVVQKDLSLIESQQKQQAPLKSKSPVQKMRSVDQQKPHVQSKTAQTMKDKVLQLKKTNPVDHILGNRKESRDGSISKKQGRGAKPPLVDPMAKAFGSIRTLVAFIGYPRSGHTLISSLLDAHPHIAVANEYQFFQKWLDFDDKQRNRLFVFKELYKASVSASQEGIRSLTEVHTFNYSVPGEWTGKYDRFLQVIGDKHGPKSAKLLSDESGRKILTEIQNKLKVSVRLIHVVRNPYDNIATMAIRASDAYGRQFIEQGKILKNVTHLVQQTRVYAGLLRDNSHLRSWFHVFDVHSIDLIAHAKETLEQICRYLHVECTDEYLTHCASMVFSSPSKTRNNVEWTPTVKAAIKYLIEKYPFLSRYSFDTD